ncbi:MAG: hypothetical protein ACFE9I_08760 [Candidatus Hermodarchaeota archaeon]
MALAGEKVGIPSAEEAPMIVMARYKQPFAGILSIIIVFIISWITWLIFFDPRWHNPYPAHEMEITAWATVIGGFGLIGVVWAIWFENWPYYNWFRTPWKVGLVGTIINFVIILIFTLLLLPLFTFFYSSEITDSYIAWFVGASIFGALSGSCFSFAVLWVAGTMYWPFFKLKQPKRGIIVWIIGNAITLLVWFFLFFPAGERTNIASELDAVKPVTEFPSYAFSLGWTQWLIFFSLLTMMVFEYWPWSKLGRKQPFIGMIAAGACTVLGLLVSLLGPYIAQYIFDPFFVAIGGVPPGGVDVVSITRFKGWYMMSITYAIFLICAVVLVSLFFDNWPKRFPQWKNFLFRFLLVIAFGTLTFLGYYLLSPILFGDTTNYWEMNPTPIVLWFLWIEILFAYVWRKWPIYRAV